MSSPRWWLAWENFSRGRFDCGLWLGGLLHFHRGWALGVYVDVYTCGFDMMIGLGPLMLRPVCIAGRFGIMATLDQREILRRGYWRAKADKDGTP